MKSSKRKHPRESKPDNLLEEPAAAYYTSPGNVGVSITLMGLKEDPVFKTVRNTADFIDRIRDGLPKKALDHLARIMGVSDAQIAGIIHTSDRTLRRYTPAQKLNAGQSERIIELARLYARGADVFDGLANFKTWMATPVDALGAKKPIEFLDTSMGIELLTDELGRIEQGIFA
ncbi:type II RES/Xre toxin-antitoxin system antitoxin [Niabella drilacis]|uniref:Putative toxin-antitoxin system antitoxin component, TIGR02293 family n=1 Tax=Niabella drilacis (strain DSM 25811 / CCM 8410 / CCUG 62505 / LMG 26954 / E90) TaxID=1285928 RepID=A0A1G6SHZ5_NIADE|nr:antitoxin Xre-like helix-turn-helix domain-containing protein [Niabella drilacis]SDD16522.1 putative toxin-antitoxin system antitoxin component, TIGR02293 family [Niabella drilacis]